MKSIDLYEDGDNFWALVITEVTFVLKKSDFFYFLRKKFSNDCAPDYSVHKYIYRSYMSGPPNITLL